MNATVPKSEIFSELNKAAKTARLACRDVLVPCLLYCFKFQRVVHDATVECLSFSFSLTGIFMEYEFYNVRSIVQDGCV